LEQNPVLSGLLNAVLINVIAYSMLISLGVAAYILYKPRRSTSRAENFEIVIVSKADHKVKNSLLESVKHHINKYGGVTVVIDEGAPLQSVLERSERVKLVVVPSNYRLDLTGKGRALQYFIDCCVDENKWYVFIDDDNLILDYSFLHEIPIYEKLGYVAANGVLVPRPGLSTISYVMDWVRFMDDLLIYRFFTGLLGKPLLGLHGDLLIVKGKVLKEIGFNKRSLTEDFEFAAELIRRGYKTWQSATRVSIKSPNNLIDLMKQRGRWFKGVLIGLKRAPAPMKLVVMLRSFTFSIGLLILFMLLPVAYYIGYIWVIVPSSLYYVTMYSYGVYKSRKPYFILLLPFFGIIEATSRLYGLLAVNSFVVIDKN
jgi:hypothetical protein